MATSSDVILPSVYKEALKRISRTAFTVFIHYNTDIGIPQWAVIDGADDTNGFWFSSFDTEAEALAFCAEMDWIVTHINGKS
jgi:hypothetical protein